MFLRQIRSSRRACVHVNSQSQVLNSYLELRRPTVALPRNISWSPVIHSLPRWKKKKEEDENKNQRARTVLYLYGLPQQTNFSDVRSSFRRFGPIKAVMMNKDINGPFKDTDEQAYIEFNLADDAMKAFEFCIMEGISIQDVPIKAEFFKNSLDTFRISPTIHISGLSDETTLDELSEFFKRYASIENIRFGRYPGTAFIDFRSTESASFVMDAHNARPLTVGSEQPLNLYYAAPSVRLRKLVQSAERPTELQEPHKRVFATKFGRPVTEQILREAFGKFDEITEVVINYYADSTSRNLAFIEFATVEGASKAVKAWQAGELAILGNELRMDFYRPPIENPPHYTLRIEGYSGGREATEHIASQFQPFVWKTFYPPGSHRRGKGSTIAFLEFDTTEHATAALERLGKIKVNDDERIIASYASRPKGWHTAGGLYKRDFGGDEFAFGLENGGTARLDEETGLFRDVLRRDQRSRLERIAKYLGRVWVPGNRNQMKSLVRELAKRRLEGASLIGANAVAEQAQPDSPVLESMKAISSTRLLGAYPRIPTARK